MKDKIRQESDEGNGGWTAFIWLTTRSSGVIVWTRHWTFDN